MARGGRRRIDGRTLTFDDSEHVDEPADRDLSGQIDSLLQVVREIEGLKKLEDLVPRELLWDRPPGLPSGVELLWLVHLVDLHVFIPSVGDTGSTDIEFEQPDYARLLTGYPCSAETLDDLLAELTISRRNLVAALRRMDPPPQANEGAQLLIDTILAHDRHVLSAFTERLYESGLGA